MEYRPDEDLEFLTKLSDKDLDELVYCLTMSEGEKRVNETMTYKDPYKNYYPRHSMYVDLIIDEIQRNGANTFATIFRGGKGVLYKEVLIDVCTKLKVNFNKNSKTDYIELKLFDKILEDAIERMTPEERKEFVESLNLNTMGDYTDKAVYAAVSLLFRAGGFTSYKLLATVANAIIKALLGRGLSIAGNCLLTRAAGVITGPIGWVVMSLWTLVDIAGPAYRVSIPTVVIVAFLRQKYNNEKLIEANKHLL